MVFKIKDIFNMEFDKKLKVIEITAAIVIGIIGICVACRQNNINETLSEYNKQQSEYNNLFVPFNYTATRGEARKYKYKIKDNKNKKIDLPAYETVFNIDSGACKEFYLIRYNGNDGETNVTGTDLKNQKSTEYIYKAITEPPNTSFYGKVQVIYDYFFVYTISSNNEEQLDLFYYTIDLNGKEVSGPYKLSPIEFIDSKRQLDVLYNDMCSNYENLIKKVNQLPVLKRN